MRKQILTFLLLGLIGSIGNVWGDGTALSTLSWSNISSAPSAYTYSTSNTPSYQSSQGPSGDKRSCMLIGNGGKGQTPTITASGPTTSEGKRWMAFCPAEDCNLSIVCTGNGKVFQLYDKDHYTAKTDVSTEDTHLSSYNGTSSWGTWTINGLKANTWYVLSATSSSSYVYSMTFTASTPTLTGAWKISTTDVTGEIAVVVQGSSPAPTMPSFTVGATSGTPTTDNYNLSYSLKGESTPGIFTFTDGVPTAISTSTAGSATIVATLTTKNSSSYLSPSPTTFEYTVTVSAATAPSITTQPANSSVSVNEEATLSVVATGVPSEFSYQWYECDDALKTNAASIDGATSASYSFTPAAAGTRYFYVVVSNGVSPDATSNVATITVNKKAHGLAYATTTVKKLSTGVNFTNALTNPNKLSVSYSSDKETVATVDAETGEVTIVGAGTAKITATTTGTEVYAAGSVNYTVSVTAAMEITAVSTATTWDWTKTGKSSSIDISSESAEADYCLALVEGIETDATKFYAPGIAVRNFQYAPRKDNSNYYAQGTAIKIKTSVAGKLTVKFSNTGSSRAYRYLYVNGQPTEFKSATAAGTSDSWSEATDIYVPAGDVELKGYIPDVSDPTKRSGESNGDNYLRWYIITFTPLAEAVPSTVGSTITACGYNTFSSIYPLDLSTLTSGMKAYVVSSITDSKAVLTASTAKVPARTGLIIKGTASTAFTIETTSDETTVPATNLLVGVPNGTTVAKASGDSYNNYVFGWTDAAAPGFYLINATSATLSAGKAYLHTSSTLTSGGATAPSIIRIEEEENNATDVQSIEANEKAVKFIENGQLLIKKDGVVYDALGRIIK